MPARAIMSRRDWLRPGLVLGWLALFVFWPRLITAITLLGIGGGMIACNAWIFWHTIIGKGEAASVAPIFGGIITAAGLAILPLEGMWRWAWLPLLIDWGGLPLLLFAAYGHVTGKRPTRGGDGP